jgi:hypothetical protein
MKSKIIFTLIIALAIAGCNKDLLKIKNIKIEDDVAGDWVIPLVKSKLTLQNIIPDSLGLLYIDSNGLYTIHYQSKVYEALAKNYISLPAQSFNTGNIVLSTGISLPTWSGTVSDNANGTFVYAATNGAQLKHIQLKAGSMQVALNTSFQHSVTATYTFASIIKSGSPLVVSVPIVYPATSASTSISLANYTVDLTNGGAGNNTIPYTVAYTLMGSGQPIAASDFINADVNITGLQFKFIDGYLGNATIPMPQDSINLQIFDKGSSTNIFMEDPQLHFTIQSNWGFSGIAKFDKLYGVNTNGTTSNIGGAFFNNPINVLGPSVVGQTYINNYFVNKTNSDLQTILNPSPNKIVYQTSLEVNPASMGITNNFVFDTSKLVVNAEAILPAWFKLNISNVLDTFPINTLPKDTSLVESIEIKTRIENAIGVTGTVQIYFQDQFYNTLDSLFTTNTIVLPEATMDATTGLVITPGVKIIIAKITNTQYKAIADKIKYGVIRASVKSSGTASVKIKAADYININMAARALLKVKLKL